MADPTTTDGRVPRIGALRGRLFPRLLLNVMLAFVPFAVVLAILLSNRGSDGITTAVHSGVSTAASALGERVDVYLRSRLRDVEFSAATISASGRTGGRHEQVALLDRLRANWGQVELFDRAGKPVRSSRPGGAFAPSGDWFTTAANGRS